MPTATVYTPRPLIPIGDHLLCLVSVEEKDFPSFNDPAKMEPRWCWQFKAQAADPESGERYEMRVYTGPSYGDPRATLTILLDQMLPDWTEEQKKTIDTDRVLQTYYKAKVYHERPTKADGNPKAKLRMIEPYKPVKKNGATAPAAPVAAAVITEEDENEFDPFAAAGE